MEFDGLDVLRMSGWQNSDENHPAGKGHPGYRVVCRCLAWITHPEVIMGSNNMRIRIAVGDVDTGGVTLPNAIPMKAHGHWVLPQKVHRTQNESSINFKGEGIYEIDFKAWQEVVPSISFVEILVRTESVDPENILSEGRTITSSMLTLLQFALGPRVAAVPLVEETGEIFEDWHWNRSLASSSLSWEPQLDMQGAHGSEVVQAMEPLIDRWIALDEGKRAQFRIACQWWQLADAQSDLVVKYLSLWLVAESLNKRKDIPEVLSEMLEIPIGRCAKFVKRIYGRRCRLAHGEDRSVGEEEINEVRCLAGTLLSEKLCTSPSPLYAAQLKQFIVPPSI
ncbi:hypothetical protein [Streptosporangium sp. NPDC006007]|uniref:hypothetical protein n=1 Tax=Streptosporangium sp. NPDC006007 TaxID=3154575 RepID=UPI0033A66654